MADLLLELFSEEIPARMQEAASEHLQNTLREKLGQPVRGFVTPRRLAVIVGNLPAMQPDIDSELKGPRIDAPEAAIRGFLKKSGMTLEQLEKRDGAYVVKIHQKGKPTAEMLKPMIEEILANFPWPKSMRWGAHEVSWVRPLHSILCIFDGKIVPAQFGPITAGNVTCGHRFLAPQAITIKKAADYETALKKAFVIADFSKRKQDIETRAEQLAAKHKLTLGPLDGLLDEVTGLVEWPQLLMGGIDEQFMDLPPEVLVTVMKKQQKYFSVFRASRLVSGEEKHELAPYFIMVSNMAAKDNGKAIVAGNERVLRARFSDARFFWDQDRKKPLEQWAEGLKSVTFHAKLGTLADKVARIGALAGQLAEHVPGADKDTVLRAAKLCKADLVTGMVGEFAELQGVMGGYYAANEGDVVATAVREHYKPQGPNDSVPGEPAAICVALADKLDTLVSMFAIGEKPSGSKDPFALRRAALGVIRIILENKIRLPLTAAFANVPLKHIALHKAHKKLISETEAQLNAPHKVGKYLTVNESASEEIPEGAADAVGRQLLAFFHDRLIVQMKDSGIRHDVIKAVVAGGDDDLLRIVSRAQALQEFLSTASGTNLLAGYKRAAGIVAIEEKKDKASYGAPVDSSILKEQPEIELARSLETNRARVEALFKEEKFTEMMALLSELRPPVDMFFDKIMVNCEDKALRANRLKLLSRIRSSMDSIANFALIEG